MHKRFFICAAVIAVLMVIVFWAYTNFELYDYTSYAPPSREARTNNYLALERWLAETGHPVRIESRGSAAKIAAAPERAALVEASVCDWENAGELLRPWIERGGFLAISIEDDFEDDALTAFLSGFGLDPEAGSGGGEESPLLAQVQAGKGALALIGRTRFMSNFNLKDEENARRAWELTGARANGENPGVFFIREKRVTKSLLGKVFDRGSALPPAVSALLLIVLGFWMVIPVFGPVFGEKRITARPIRERFCAETRFLKKYGALGHYLAVYERELKRAEGGKRPVKYRDIIRKLKKLEALTERI